jgi:branched-chain amino acid transport system permease protein
MKVNISQFRGKLIPLVVVIVLLAVLPVIGAPRQWLLYLLLFLIYMAMSNMWNLLAGYAGLLCLCPAAFIGIAGYTLAISTWVGVPLLLAIIAGAVIAAVFALLISIPVFRLRGTYFAIGTLVVPEALRYVFFIWRPVGGGLAGGGAGYMIKGVSGIEMTWVYWGALFIGIVSILLMRLMLRSSLGLGLAAIRDNDVTAANSGVSVFRLKLYAFVIAAFVIGLAGSIFYTYQGHIEPTSAFNLRWLMTLLLATVIGGEGIEEGPIVGTIVVVILHFLLAKYAGISLLIQGVILVVIMLLAPQGIMGFLRKTRIYRSLLKSTQRE